MIAARIRSRLLDPRLIHPRHSRHVHGGYRNWIDLGAGNLRGRGGNRADEQGQDGHEGKEEPHSWRIATPELSICRCAGPKTRSDARCRRSTRAVGSPEKVRRRGESQATLDAASAPADPYKFPRHAAQAPCTSTIVLRARNLLRAESGTIEAGPMENSSVRPQQSQIRNCGQWSGSAAVQAT